MSGFIQWVSKWFRTFDHFPEYTRSALSSWNGILWGGSVTAALFLFLGALGLATKTAIYCWLVTALFMAGYYVWRADHIRLMPKFVFDQIDIQPTPLVNTSTGQTGSCIYLQLYPRCLTDADIENCEPWLRSTCSRSDETEVWKLTEMNESVRLGWSHDDDPRRVPPFPPITLQSGNERRLNVVCITSDNSIHPIVHPTPLRAIEVLTCDKEFLFDIVIRGKDCPHVRLFVRLKRGTTWDKPDYELLQAGEIDESGIQRRTRSIKEL
jgi:hypothetical protein